MSDRKKNWVMDYETLADCFLAVFEEYKSDEVHVFTICKLRNDLPKLLDFLKQNIRNKEWHISFNGLAFDSQITEYIIQNHTKFLKQSGEDVAKKIYSKAQDCIQRSNAREFQEWSETKLSIKQIDIFKLNHWDNPAKSSSLKYIQYTTDWHNIQDMPIDHTESINTVEQLKTVASYCRNDVASTKFIAMVKSAKQIELRGTLTKQYGINLYSASEPRIAKELFLLFLSQRANIPAKAMKKLRTHRKSIQVRRILLPYLNFKTQEFKKMLFTFQHLIINAVNTKDAFKYSLHYRGVETKMGLGGIHGAKKGIYEEGNGMIIMTSDVVSYYPNLAIRNKWAPAHLPQKEFSELYEWFFNERRKISKKDIRNYVYKIILNATFGLSIDKHSFLYDVELGMKITINGQLSLMMLYEMLAEEVPGCIPLMQNTDGVEMLIPEQYKDLYLEICKRWEGITKLELEHDQYHKIIIPDVNNYVAIGKLKEITKEEYEEHKIENPHNIYVHENGTYKYATTKCKGRFDFNDLALHKNKSFLIIRKALFYYFVHGIEPEDYLKQNRNIFDYCAGAKAKSPWQFIETGVKNGAFYETKLQKTIRYYSSKSGSKLMKFNKADQRKHNVEKAGQQTIFNVYQEKTWEEYNVDDSFYIKKIRKEIAGLIPNLYKQQVSLF